MLGGIIKDNTLVIERNNRRWIKIKYELFKGFWVDTSSIITKFNEFLEYLST